MRSEDDADIAFRKDSRTSSENPKLADLVFHYIEKLNAGEEIDEDQILRDQPELGPAIVEELRMYQHLDSDRLAIDGEPLGTLGDYTLRRRIGRGGMGVVYEAWENSMDRVVALKVLPAALAADSKAFLRFMREAKTAGQVTHQNVVRVYSMGVKDQTPYYAMELVEGETLAQVLSRLKDADLETETPFGKKDRPAYFEKLAEAFADVAEGLQHAHMKGVVHRDIKPSNLILDKECRLRILDFGLARFEGQQSLTLSGDLVGTPLYMSPEQAMCKKTPIDHRTDIYSLGATMYETLAGRPPFQGRNHADTLSLIIGRDPVESRRLNPRVPKDLDTIVLKCLRKDAGDRYGTAEALAQDLRRFVRSDAIEAKPQLAMEKLLRRAWRQRWRIITGVCVLLLLVTTGLLVRSHFLEVLKKEDELYRQNVLGAFMKLELGRMIIRAESERASGQDIWRFLTRWGARPSRGGGGLGPIESAMEELENAAGAFPGKPGIYYHRAKGLLLLGQEEEAMKALDRALLTDRAFTPAMVLRAAIFEARGDTHGSRREMDRARRLGNSEWADHWQSASLAEFRRDWKRAAEAYSKLIQLETPGPEPFLGAFLEARLGRGNAFLEAKDYFRALEDFTSARVLWRDLNELPRSKLRGISIKVFEQIQLLMQSLVFFFSSLLLHVLAYAFLVPMDSHRAYEISF